MASNLRRMDSFPSTPRTSVDGAASIGTCVSHPMFTGFGSVSSFESVLSGDSTVARRCDMARLVGTTDCTKAPAEET